MGGLHCLLFAANGKKARETKPKKIQMGGQQVLEGNGSRQRKKWGACMHLLAVEGACPGGSMAVSSHS